ncbi:MAG: biotin carboxylase [Neobacillus sp.]|nr:biotin carboxylase [Neobacillus sp.]
MKSIVFLGTNRMGSSYEGVKAAKTLGYHTILLTNRILFMEEKEVFPEIDMVRLTDLSSTDDIFKAIAELISKDYEIGCFISFLDEYVHLAAMLTNELCNSSLSFEPLIIMADKIATRNYLSQKDYTPFYRILLAKDSIDEAGKGLKDFFPLIIKSPQSNASKDVFLAESFREFKKSVKRIQSKNPNNPILVEEYLKGPQYLVEVVVYNGKVSLPAIVEQEVTKGERFIITGYSLCPEIPTALLQGLEETVKSIIADLHLENGTCHLELKLTDKGWRLIEINPRMAGGTMNRMIEEAYGFNLAEQTIRLFCGHEPNFTRKHEKYVYTHYLIIEAIGRLLKVSGEELAKSESGVLEVFTKGKTGQIVTPPRSMGHRYGYVLAAADSRELAKNLAIKAAEKIQFYLQPF